MAIRNKYVRSIHHYLDHIPQGVDVRFGVRLDDISHAQLDEVGAASTLTAGDAFLPSFVGATSRFNADGR